MTNGMRKAALLPLVLATALGGCDSANLPSAPTAIEQRADPRQILRITTHVRADERRARMTFDEVRQAIHDAYK